MKRLSPEEQRAARRTSQVVRRAPRAPSPAAKKIRKEMAIEAQYRRCLHLECGHIGLREDTDVLMRSLRPSNDAWYCDVEGKWTTLRQVNIERIPLPEKAPF